MTISPVTLIRWALFGKRLDEILSGFDRMQQQLERCRLRNFKRLARKEQRIRRLEAKNVAHTATLDKAYVVHSNLDVLMNQHIRPQEPAA